MTTQEPDVAARERIIEATVQVLADEGYAKASVSRIAGAAGTSKALVLYHFGTKDDLIVAAFFRTYERIAEGLWSDVDPASPPPQLLRDLVLTTARHGRGQRRERMAIAQVVSALGTTPHPRISFSDKEPIHRGYEEVIRAGQKAGNFRDVDARVAAVMIQGAIDTMFRDVDSRPGADLDAHAEALADLLLAALRA